ncbi:M3 family metallopeptidase [cf. Phormidesmis sp. LEGE 11477]|uniref:M3 family metallopeptidase n=1 Tax=cf. Phormidesmis sp. LEGE 11477 TaxID=1828680 RepID=UPI00187E5539|nr:M3 family metallopeptidase [cf. Phormidesmis sp. LEGE 11477]MBE9062775.1 M3 family metallopeptidase [cf. Phormidesmis sp. LEGE 11477]
MSVSAPEKLSSAVSSNPLLIGKGLPPFNDIEPQHVVPGIEQLLTSLRASLAAIEADIAANLAKSSPATPTWETLVEPLNVITEKLGWSWGIIGHLMGVKNSPELRTAYESVQPALVQFSNQLSQSRPIYDALKQLRASAAGKSLAPAQQRIIESALRDAELSGVGLSGERKEKFNQIQQSLAELSTQFSNHVLDATKAFSLTLSQKEEIAGLPSSLLSLAAQAARDAGEEGVIAQSGPWRITLDMPSYIPFLRHSQRRDLREQLYRAFITRASAGDLDNAPLIEQILDLRQQQAELLGFSNYAELSLARKMAPSVSAVEDLMEELRSASYSAARQELEAIKTFAQAHAADFTELKQWDVPFWMERMREEQFDLNDEALRPYFSLPNVLQGLFGLAERLFNITISADDGSAPVWHPDVRYFQVSDSTTQETIAHFYLDPYSRPAEKRGGAWMDECIVRAKVTENNQSQVRLPVAYLVCNQSPPVDGKPSLMTFREVETLFHEFGHGLQHMLTSVDYAGAAGINNVEWDAVELPSQFMENWCYERETLFGMAQHYETGEPLPEADYQKLLAARHFMTGNAILRQVNFGWVDMALHADYRKDGDESVWQVRDRIAKKTTIMPPLSEDAALCSFGHIFAGGYAAGYYSYFWAEVLSADAFSAFEEAGLENKAKVATIGRKFRDTVLSLGGSRHPMEVFKSFRGREPSTQALLRHRGLVS